MLAAPRLSGLLLCRLRRHEEPPQGNQESNAAADTEGAVRADLVEDGAAGETADEKSEDSHDFVVTGDDEPVEREQLRVRHELTPHGGEHD